MAIHPTAIIDRSAELDPTVEVGPYAIIEADVQIGAFSRIHAHAFIGRYTTIGSRSQVHPFAVVGGLPQDFAFKDVPSYTEIGDDTVIREGASVHRGTAAESVTRIGNRCFLMAQAHVAHNVILGDDVKLASFTGISGHVQIGNGAFLSGFVGVHQFARIGELCMVAAHVRLPNDVPPFMMMASFGVVGPNVIGLRRAGLSSEERLELRHCHRILYRSGRGFRAAIQEISDFARTAPGRRLVDFLHSPSKRGYAGLRRRYRYSDDPETSEA